MMGLALMVLVLNGGLAQADRIAGMNIWRAQPGQITKDVIHNNTVFSGTPGGSGSLLIASGARSALETVQQKTVAPIKRLQQRRIGNIGRASSPRSPFGRGNIGAGIARGAPQLKLTIDHVQNERGRRIESVSSGDRVEVFFTVQNLGTAQAVTYIRNLRGDRSPKMIVGPGRRNSSRIQMIVRKNEIDRKRHTWAPAIYPVRCISTFSQFQSSDP